PPLPWFVLLAQNVAIAPWMASVSSSPTLAPLTVVEAAAERFNVFPAIDVIVASSTSPDAPAPLTCTPMPTLKPVELATLSALDPDVIEPVVLSAPPSPTAPYAGAVMSMYGLGPCQDVSPFTVSEASGPGLKV